jgi:predicted nucleic acid-binding protein
MFLEVAISSLAEVLITGNKQHFPLDSSEQLKIMSPAEFIDFFNQSLK